MIFTHRINFEDQGWGFEVSSHDSGDYNRIFVPAMPGRKSSLFSSELIIGEIPFAPPSFKPYF